METTRATLAADASSPLGVISRSLGKWRRLAPRLRRPDLGDVRSLVDELGDVLEALNRSAGLDAGAARLVRDTVLHASFPVLLRVREGQADAAASQLLHLWQATLRGFGWDEGGIASAESEVAESPRLLASASGEAADLLPLFTLAIFGRLTEGQGQERARQALARLAELLRLSLDQLGRMLGVSGETVRRWTRGSHRVPEERSARIARADAALGRLLAVFQPARLPQVVRRRADLFDGESALDWMLRGKIAEVADRYELALSYQG
jgi:transcriptional regulator with XRE-family HTH domain